MLVGSEIKDALKDSGFSYKEPELLRQKRPSRRLQALVGETGYTEISQYIKEFYSMRAYYPALDKVVSGLEWIGDWIGLD